MTEERLPPLDEIVKKPAPHPSKAERAAEKRAREERVRVFTQEIEAKRAETRALFEEFLQKAPHVMWGSRRAGFAVKDKLWIYESLFGGPKIYTVTRSTHHDPWRKERFSLQGWDRRKGLARGSVGSPDTTEPDKWRALLEHALRHPVHPRS